MPAKFPTDKTENFRARISRFGFNLFPAYRRSGAKISFISSDWKEVHIKLGLKWSTRNYVGSVFGGSIYSALDPIYMIQLIQLLGRDYIVWDKSAEIHFRKPIRKTVHARFLITDEILTEIRAAVASGNKYTIDLTTRFEDPEGTVYAEVIKTIFIADKAYYKKRQQS